MWESCIHQVNTGLQLNLFKDFKSIKDFQSVDITTMAKHKLTTFRQTDLAMH